MGSSSVTRMHTHTHAHTQVYEETGFDIRDLIQESQYLEAQVGDNNARMYIIPGVPEETSFAPKTRKEIRVKIPHTDTLIRTSQGTLKYGHFAFRTHF